VKNIIDGEWSELQSGIDSLWFKMSEIYDFEIAKPDKEVRATPSNKI
jgi:hypothetical protein